MDRTTVVTRWLFATRLRTLVATAFTAFMFVDFVWAELLPVEPKPGGLFRTGPDWAFTSNWLHGWTLIAVNLAIWGLLCWFACSCVYESEGRERLFVIDWFAEIPFWPVRWFEPQWIQAMRLIGIAGLAVALCVGFSALLHPPNIPGANEGPSGS